MLAIDTNVVVRIITRDDPSASERARRLMSENSVYLSATVLLETAWVLGHTYGLGREGVVRALRHFAGLPGVVLEAPDEVHRALAWTEEGVDIADAFHLALTGARGAFATFDRDLLRQARARQLAVVEP